MNKGTLDKVGKKKVLAKPPKGVGVWGNSEIYTLQTIITKMKKMLIEDKKADLKKGYYYFSTDGELKRYQAVLNKFDSAIKAFVKVTHNADIDEDEGDDDDVDL